MRWRRFGKLRPPQDHRSQPDQRSIFSTVEQLLRTEVPIAKRRWRRHTDFDYLRPLIDSARQRAHIAEQNGTADSKALAWIRALVLQAPHAAQAQAQMDRHRHGFHNKELRVLELIDFNDAYIGAALSVPTSQLHSFNGEVRRLIDWFCKRVGALSFSDEQFEAITHGLSREIAVYNAVRTAGYSAQMTSRSEDAFGIDIHITDVVTGRIVHVDTKTTAAFHYRLIELLSEGRMSDEDIALAEQRGYAAVYNGHGSEKVRVILWRIDHASLGDINDFAFADSVALVVELREIFAAYGEY